MVEILAHFALSSLLIVVAGVYLTRSADKIAEITGLGKLIIGSILLAGATSLTELFVGISAVKSHLAELAMGNLLGACLVNLLILAIADAVHHSHKKRFSLTSAAHALSACQLVILISIVAMGILLTPATGSFTFLNASIPSYLLLFIYLLSMRIIYKNHNHLQVTKITFKFPLKKIYSSLIIFTVSALAIAYACPLLVHSADAFSQFTGIGESFIGLTLVSLATSLPEMVATISAVRIGSYEMAFGNILGSNAYNMIVIAFLDFAVDGAIFSTIGTVHIFTCLSIIICIAIAIIGQLYQVERKKHFLEPDAVIIILVVILSYFTLYQFSGA